MASTRTETDTFGPIEVEGDRYWGAQAQRSLGNFKIGWEKQPLAVVRALGIVKQAAARANMELAGLDGTVGKAIIDAAQEVIDGKLTTTPVSTRTPGPDGQVIVFRRPGAGRKPAAGSSPLMRNSRECPRIAGES